VLSVTNLTAVRSDARLASWSEAGEVTGIKARRFLLALDTKCGRVWIGGPGSEPN